MADESKSADQSMEEILQSIKRIIAEEDDGDNSSNTASDVLELTESVDGGEVDIEVEDAQEGEDSMAVDALLDSLADAQDDDTGPSEDVQANPEDVEAMFAKDTPAEEEPVSDAPEAPAPEDALVPEVPDSAEEDDIPPIAEATEDLPEIEEDTPIDTAEAPTDDDSEGLIEDVTAAASAAALKQLISPETPRESDHLAFRSGTTVEELIVDAMRPMLKEWLNSNLPGIVEELVQREIRKITAHLN
jgi:cell pole-organizing protein PopZ